MAAKVFEHLRRAAAHRHAVELVAPQAQVRGTRDQDLLRAPERIQVVGGLRNRIAQLLCHADQVRSCDARQDQLIRGCGEDLAVQNDVDVGVRALGDPVSEVLAVEDRLLHAFLLGVLCCHDGGHQVQGLHVAVVEPGIRLGHAGDGLLPVADRGGGQGHPEICGDLGIKGVVAVGGAAPGHLVVDEQIAGVHLLDELIQKILQLVLGDRHLDVHQRRTVEEAVHVFVDGEDVVVPAGAGIIDAVTEPVNPVVHRDHHVLDLIVFPVVVSKCLHSQLLFRGSAPERKKAPGS